MAKRLSDFRVWLGLLVAFVLYILYQWHSSDIQADIQTPHQPRSTPYHITKTWDGLEVSHSAIEISISPSPDGVQIKVDAPFFGDPPNPGGKAGEPFPGLWDHEVVEVFFLNKANKYLEVELCPHGQHLVLLLSDYRKSFKEGLPLDFQATIDGDKWHGEATIPAKYFPKEVTRMNAYAIHGSGDKRVYMSLYPVPSGKFKDPDFHRLDYFQQFDLAHTLSSNADDTYRSEVWEPPAS